MSDKELATFVDEPALGALCACLGQIPVGQPPFPNRPLSMDWDTISGVDWNRVVSKVENEGLAPLIYWILSKSGKFSSIPEATRNILRLVYFGTWMKNKNIFRELEALARPFELAEIPIVVLKGACYAQTIYPDIGLRPMGDLDVLLPAAKLSQAVQIAKSIGFVEQLEADPEIMDLNYHVCLQKTSPQEILVELHGSLVAAKSYKYAIPMDWFWDQTEPIVVLSTGEQLGNMYMLTPTAQVLYAASHAILQHAGKKVPLRWFYDLDRLLRFYSGRMDWDLLLSQAKIFEWSSVLETALFKTIAYFETPIPEHVLTILSGSSDRSRKIVALKQIEPATYMLQEIHKLSLLRGFSRFLYFLALIFPNPAYMRWRFRLKTSWAIPVYYLIRWWHIVKGGLLTLVSLIKQRIILK